MTTADHAATTDFSPGMALTHDADRFAFGANWRRFLAVLDEPRIARAEASLLAMFKERAFEGRTFLDIGSGS
ncbi:MAG: hypothetical protein ACM36C_14375, partial [Acidobacteriota bacterium]